MSLKPSQLPNTYVMFDREIEQGDACARRG